MNFLAYPKSNLKFPVLKKAIGATFCAYLGVFGIGCKASAGEASLNAVDSLKNNLARSANWELVNQQLLPFDTYHPQGLVKIGDSFFLSAVETLVSPARFDEPQGSYDRSTGSGIGHLFKFSEDGELRADLKLGEGSMYHPGGIDFDGNNIWISLAEYRPNSQSIVYKVDLDSLTADEQFRFSDHLGGVLKDPETDTLFGISWGSRRFYRWQGVTGDFNGDEGAVVNNGSFYIDYQDCQWLPKHMLCSGVKSYQGRDGNFLKLGGIDLIELETLRPTLQLPVTRTTEKGTVLTQNPFYFEINERGELIFYFIPEDNASTLYTFRVNK